MNPTSFAQPTQALLVPSIAVPSQTVVVQPLSPNARPLSNQDIYVLQRTVIPVGQQWLYSLNGPNQSSSLVQIQMWITPTLTPHEHLTVPHVLVPPEMAYADENMALIAAMSGYDADTEATGSDMTGQIYGD